MKIALFADRSGARIDHVELDWDYVCQQFSNPPEVDDKAQCQLFSLCEYGDKRTERGSLRSNDNVVQIWGVCGDYDGEAVPMASAVDALRAVGVRALAYTSPSHREEAPRWRIVCPFDGPASPAEHAAAVEKINGVVGGGLSSESFTLSQPFYVGRVKGHPFASAVVPGADIRALDLPRLPWRGAARAEGGFRVDTATLVAELESGTEVHPAIISLAMRGFSCEELEDIVRRGASSWPRPERADVAIQQDIPRAVESAARKRQGDLEKRLAAIPPPPLPPPAPPRVSIFKRAGELTHKPRPLNWLVRDRLEHPVFVSVFGPPEQGKTFVCIDLACCVATGRPWRGNPVTKGRVIYFAGEGHNGIGRRLLAWKIANGVNDEEWNAAELYVTERAVNMNSPEAMQGVYEEFTAMGPPSLAIIDTLTRHTPGVDQSSQKDMTPFVFMCSEIVRTYGCTVMLVQHTGQANVERAMGSIVVKGAVDVEMRVMKVAGGAIELSNTKSKESERWPDQFFRFQTVDLPWLENPDAGPDEVPRRQSSAVLVDADAPIDTSKAGRPNKGVQLLREALQGGPLSETMAREAFKRLHSGDSKVAGRSFRRSLEQALAAGLVLYDEEAATYKLAFA